MCLCVIEIENERGTFVCVWFKNRKREKREEPTSVCVCIYKIDNVREGFTKRVLYKEIVYLPWCVLRNQISFAAKQCSSTKISKQLKKETYSAPQNQNL